MCSSDLTNEVYNFIGFSLQDGAIVTPDAYVDGFDGGILKGGFFKFGGRYEDKSPSITPVYSSVTVSDGDVLLAASGAQSDWSGVLYVAPMTGLDFGPDGVQRTLSVRNDGSAARTVAIDIFDGEEEKELELRRSWLHVRDGDAASTGAVWTAVADGQTRLAEKRLEGGETWRFQVGLDRKALASQVRGLSFGAVLRVVDLDGGSKMRADVPIAGETSGGTTQSMAWPGGLWIADVALDAVKGPGDSAATEAGGTMRLRLPIHVDANGTMRLLQRVVAAGHVGKARDVDVGQHLVGAVLLRLYLLLVAMPQGEILILQSRNESCYFIDGVHNVASLYNYCTRSESPIDSLLELFLGFSRSISLT